MVVEFKNPEDIERWLRNKPREVEISIAARAALRAVPGIRFGDSEKKIIATLRAAAAPWAVARYPARGAEMRTALRASGATNFVARSSASAIAATRATDNDSRSAALAAGYSAQAAAQFRVPTIRSYGEVAEDAGMIERGASAVTLANQRLWRAGIPDHALNVWRRLKYSWLAQEAEWLVWTQWYEARLEGHVSNEQLEVRRVLIPDEIWSRGPRILNFEIGRLIREYEAKPFQLPDLDGAPTLPHRPTPLAVVPAQKPAAVETVWNKGKLSLQRRPAKSSLSKKKLEAAFAALRSDLLELASDANAEGNIDKRPSEFLQRLARRIPQMSPPQDELFRLGHAEAILAGYAKVVAQEWPDFLAARYYAVSLQFDRTMRQSPLWREFVANAAKQTMSAAQITDATLLASEAAKALQQEEAPAFVALVVPRALEELADALPVTPSTGSDAVEAGKELLAADLVESVNNTLKPIAEVALSAARDYADGVGKGFKKAAKKQGPIDGEKAFKWLRRLAIGGGAGAGSFVALSNLIAKFPEAFAWLERVLHFLK